MCIRYRFGDAAHDDGQAGAQLLGRAVCHVAERPDVGDLGPPCLRVLNALEEVWQDDLHTVPGEAGHDQSGGVDGDLTDFFLSVAEILHKYPHHLYDIWLNESAKYLNDRLDEVQRRLLLLHRLLLVATLLVKLLEHAHGLQALYTEATE